MLDHDEARVLASARADGEEHDAAALDAHLAGCAECAAYAAGLARLSTLTAALPREAAPVDLADRLARRVRRRRLLRWAPALAAATAAAVVYAVLPTGAFPLPDAAAAEPLRDLRTLYVERTVSGPDGDVAERIWWRAPASLRVETTFRGRTDVLIRTPGVRFSGGVLTRGVTPDVPLPEPLSPTVALLGTDTGPGPVVAGRPTRRLELRGGASSRVAFVDTERAVALGGEEALVLGKRSRDLTKRVTRVDRDPPLADALFEPPPDAGPAVDGGFRAAGLRALRIRPERVPDGFETVIAGTGPGGEAALFADGSMPLLVTVAPLEPSELSTVRGVERDGRTYRVTIDLYALPSVEVPYRGQTVRVVAPLPVDSLVDLAIRMYPPE